jgi:arginine/lysine/ornithine decarboxylase
VGEEVFKIDTTDEFDNLGTLHPATGPVKKAQELAAEAFGAKRTFFLTCGSTIGNLAIALGATKPGEEIVIGRNCHRSVLTGTILSGANPTWVIPKKLEDWAIFGAVTAQNLENVLKNSKDVKLVWLTNPTYEGIISDIPAISKVCKKYQIPLVVDEAHGCLWHFSKKMPKSSLELGADMVVHSLHKTGGSLTQTSMLHIGKNSIFDETHVEKALKILHTTSPSMLLLASLDNARATLSSKEGEAAINKAIDNAKFLREELKKIKNISVLDEKANVDFDITKIFIKVKGLCGKSLENILEKDYKIEIESASDEGILILSNIGNTREEFEYLLNSLKDIAHKHYDKAQNCENLRYMPLVDPKILMSPRDAYFAPTETVKKYDAIGRICTEVIALCPPGISILLPGELIREEHMPYLLDREKIEVLKVR